jgi:3-hydroxyisobutyrate dehydrogenase
MSTTPSPERAPLAPGARIAFIGLGNMGRPMSARAVAAGYAVTGHDVDPAAWERMTGDHEPERAKSARAAVDGADATILMLPASDHVERALREDGVLEAMAEGSLLIDMSSSEPLRTRALGEEAAARGLRMLDAPVSGGVSGAREGTLTIMAGGEEADLAEARPLLETMGAKVLHCGALGAGHASKALNNLLSATSVTAATEALRAGEAFGLDPERLVEVFNVSSGRSYATEYKLPTFVMPRTFDSGFTLRLMLKDLDIAVKLQREVGAPGPHSEHLAELWRREAERLPADADHTEIGRPLDDS